MAATLAGGYAADLGDLKPRVGLIGAGWYGKCDLLRMIQVAPVEVVALCDVDSRMAEEAAGLVATRQLSRRKPAVFGDYRKMLSAERFDVVLVATPDHWHALPAIAAMEAGADVYVEKPTGVDVSEGAAMVTAARRLGRVVQVNTQRRSTPHLVEAKERVVDAGLLGPVRHAEICCYYKMRTSKTPQEARAEAPPHLDWEMWSGPAPLRDFNSVVHPRGWRAFMEYGNGIVGDMCVHMLDAVRWMLGLGWPERISSSGGILVDRASIANITDTQSAVFEFPELDVVWQHRTWGAPADPRYPWAFFLYGEKGTLKADVHRYEFFPSGKQEPAMSGEALFEFDRYPEDETEERLERHVASAIRAHVRNFLECTQTRARPVADVEEGHRSSASCILANHAMALGRTLRWDGERVVDDEEANALLARPYRAPWRHPAAG